MKPNPTYFPTPSDFRKWLEENHDKVQEFWVGFHKKSSGKPSIDWPQSVDEALCFGWIDGLRKSVNEISYMIRFTPRKSGSTWSAINVKRVKELTTLGKMHSTGLKAFEVHANNPKGKSGIYSYEQRKAAELDQAQERQFRANKKAWDFFQSKPPGYRRTAIYWVLNAKKEETRNSRLATLIKDSAARRTIAPLTRPAKAAK
jgi:uncharacterized protein YdeI (YjbR/CyaY-like superfamily)